MILAGETLGCPVAESCAPIAAVGIVELALGHRPVLLDDDARAAQIVATLQQIPRSLLQRLGQMLGPKRLLPSDIRDGARYLEHAMIGPRAQVHLLDRGAHEIDCGRVRGGKGDLTLLEVRHLVSLLC